MIAIVHTSLLKGNSRAPKSKSDMQRVCAAALLHQGVTTILEPGRSNDDMAALDIISKLGATVKHGRDSIVIESKGVVPSHAIINCGESGLGSRMFTPIAATSDKALTITGERTLLSRPMNFFDEVFPQLGVHISSNLGKLPLQIKGPLIPVDIKIDGSLSSQFLTGLLLAYAASNPKQIEINVTNLKSKPYIDMTLQVIEAFGMKSPQVKSYSSFYFDEKDHLANTENITYKIEGDWSGAAFLLVAGAITGSVNVEGLNSNSYQADKKIIVALQLAGAGIEWENEMIQVQRKELNAFHFDATECPDLFPPLVALAAFCKGETKILGANRLKHKESDRAASLVGEFSKLGLQIKQEDDCLLIQGVDQLAGGVAESQGDHRIAMALAVAGLRSTAAVVIHQAESVAKSYPHFFDDFAKLGASVSLTTEN